MDPSTPTCPTPSAPCSRRRQESDTEEGGGTPQAPTLTERQLEILSSVSRGLSNKDIDKSFGISSDGVKKHLRLIFGKLGTATRAEAAAKTLHDKLLKF